MQPRLANVKQSASKNLILTPFAEVERAAPSVSPSKHSVTRLPQPGQDGDIGSYSEATLWRPTPSIASPAVVALDAARRRCMHTQLMSRATTSHILATSFAGLSCSSCAESGGEARRMTAKACQVAASPPCEAGSKRLARPASSPSINSHRLPSRPSSSKGLPKHTAYHFRASPATRPHSACVARSLGSSAAATSAPSRRRPQSATVASKGGRFSLLLSSESHSIPELHDDNTITPEATDAQQDSDAWHIGLKTPTHGIDADSAHLNRTDPPEQPEPDRVRINAGGAESRTGILACRRIYGGLPPKPISEAERAAEIARALGPVGSLERCLAETQGTAVVRPPHRTRCNHARHGLAVRESDYIASSLAARKQNVQRIVETVYACLRRMPALAQLPNESILRMARMGRLQRRSRYQKIYHEGARPEGLFVLVSGSVRLSSASDVTGRDLRPPAVFGLEALAMLGEVTSGIRPVERLEHAMALQSSMCVHISGALARTAVLEMAALTPFFSFQPPSRPNGLAPGSTRYDAVRAQEDR